MSAKVELNWEAVARQHLHPTKLAILDHFREGHELASPKELAAVFGEPLGQIAYHVKSLFEAGTLELVETKQRRGALEHFYKLAPGVVR